MENLKEEVKNKSVEVSDLQVENCNLKNELLTKDGII